MSRHPPANVVATVQEGSVLVTWELEQFFADSESPHKIFIEFGGQEGPTLDGDERSIELAADLLMPFAGSVLAINVGFQWNGQETLWSAAIPLIFIPAPGDGPPLPPPPPPANAPPAPTSFNVSLQGDRLALLTWINPVSYDKILVRWGPINTEPAQFELGGTEAADCGPVLAGLYMFQVKGGISRFLGGYDYSEWSSKVLDAPEILWKHSLPGFGHEKVAPGTSPTSWYTTPENVQHIAYVGTDQQIHELFYRIGGENRWFHSVLSAGHEKVAPGTSPTSWYTTPENIQHIAYVGTDQQIHELFYRIGGENRWLHNVPSAGQEKVAPNTSPTSWYTTPENVQHIAYVGTDMEVHELFFRVRAGEVWHHRRLATEGPAIAAVERGTSPTSWYTTPENVQHIAYVGSDKQIHELFYKIL